MSETQILVAFAIFINVVAIVAGTIRARRKRRPPQSETRAPAEQKPVVAAKLTEVAAAPLPLGFVQAVMAASPRAQALWQSLLIKVLYDEAKALRLVQFEHAEVRRKGQTDPPIVELMQRAVERWERDNAS